MVHTGIPGLYWAAFYAFTLFVLFCLRRISPKSARSSSCRFDLGYLRAAFLALPEAVALRVGSPLSKALDSASL
jgi:hypothetical protein